MFITYNSGLKLLHKSLVSLDLLVALVGGEHGHAYGDRTIGLLEGDVDLLLELLHVQTRVVPVLYQRQVHVPDHRL